MTYPRVSVRIRLLLVVALAALTLPGSAGGKTDPSRQKSVPAKAEGFLSVRALSVATREVGVFTPADLAKPRPAGWELKEFSGVSSVAMERVDGQVAVRLKSDSSSFGLHRKIEVDSREYPYLTWAWRVERLPRNGDIRAKDTDDQAAQIYVVFPRFPSMLRSHILGYIWDSKASVGTTLTSLSNPMARIIVVRSGVGQMGGWVREVRNVAEDYRRVYGGEPPRIGKVSLLINSQHTKTVAESVFADIAFLKRVPPEWTDLVTILPPRRGR